MTAAAMVLAAVHLPPSIGVPVAAAALLGILWQGLRLARPDVPPSRRRVRRTAAAVMAMLVGLLTAGGCFIDPARQPTAYVLAWAVTLLMLLVLVGLAVLDGLVSSWIIRLERDGEAMKRGLAALAALEAAAAPDDAAEPAEPAEPTEPADVGADPPAKPAEDPP